MVNYEIKEEDGKLHVCVTVPPIPTQGPWTLVKVYTDQVVKHLMENNIKFGKIIKNDTAHNLHGDPSGHWIFEIPLVKSSKQVILKEEKPVKPKPKTSPKPKAKAPRKKRTRSSTKKVSTEE